MDTASAEFNMKTIFAKILLFSFTIGVVLPYCISSDDWFIFGMGVTIIITLSFVTFNEMVSFYQKKVLKND